jgi:hypothetical protein
VLAWGSLAIDAGRLNTSSHWLSSAVVTSAFHCGLPLEHAAPRGGGGQAHAALPLLQLLPAAERYGSVLAYARAASPPYDMSANAVNDHSTAAAAVSAPAVSVDDGPARAAGSQRLPQTVASAAPAVRAASPARAAPAVAPITVLTAEPVHEATACGDLNGVRALVAAAGDDPATRQQRRLDGATALHVAAAGGHAAIAAFLVGAGWRLGAVTDEGSTPLHVAAASGHGPALAAMLTAAFARRVRAVAERVTAGVASGTAAATATATAAATDAATSELLPGNDEELRRAVAAEDPNCRTWLRVALAAGHGEAALAGALALPQPSVSGAAAGVLAALPVGVDAEWWLTDALGSGSASSAAVVPQLLGLLSDEQLLALASRPGPHGPTPPAAWVQLSLQNSSAAPVLAALLPRLPRGVLQRLFDFDGCGLPPGLVSVQPHPAAQLVASVAATGAASATWLAAELVILCLHTLTADSADAALSSLLVLLPHLPAAELIAVRQPRCLACPAVRLAATAGAAGPRGAGMRPGWTGRPRGAAAATPLCAALGAGRRRRHGGRRGSAAAGCWRCWCPLSSAGGRGSGCRCCCGGGRGSGRVLWRRCHRSIAGAY